MKGKKEKQIQQPAIRKPKPSLFLENGVVVANDSNSISALEQGFYGERENGKLKLSPIEALYLVNIRKCPCAQQGKNIVFSDLINIFSGESRIFARYNLYRDWRDRGLIPQFPERMELKNFGRSPVVKYPSGKFALPPLDTELLYLPEDMVSIARCDERTKQLFERFWLGQLGVYKQQHRDNILKFDFMETLLLAKNGFAVKNNKNEKIMGFEELMDLIKEYQKNVNALFDVYEDWRARGYIIKTGFKFGTHFRLYFPGASPNREKSKWIHSKHVIHVFPKNVSMIMSEWARVVRVAHSVRKTFIMAIPGMKESDYIKEGKLIDFIGYHRKKIGLEKPGESNPKFAIISFTEDEKLGGKELASALSKADELGLRLMIGISDRETSVTYYVAKRIDLPGSRNKYYEIEWNQP
ncbi:MAG: tRNA-intron lyase [Candidatus Aenigmarchaeota archaeon]|nr:tRNA-intron lyase [Candidatus Aenigmarchaeota archaeon]